MSWYAWLLNPTGWTATVVETSLQIGILFAVAAVIAGFLRRLLARQTRPLHDAQWSELLQDLQHVLGISRPVRVWTSDAGVVPMTWGLWRPVILLPSESVSWSRDRRRVVLLHELAHIRRLDLPLQWLARAACAARRRRCVRFSSWPHPTPGRKVSGALLREFIEYLERRR